MGTGIEFLIFAASTGYQMYQMKKQQKKAALAADQRKGFSFTATGEARALPVVYGKNLLGGVEVKHKVNNGYTSATDNSDKTFAENFTNVTKGGAKNEFLNVQYAICYDGIEGVQWIKVNGSHYDENGAKFNHIIRTHADGGTADAISTANGIPSTNTFTNTASASATFKLDRDEQQYSGPPSMEFLVKGAKVKYVEETSGVYSLSSNKIYSNNPALCLLDYLTNSTYGRGLASSSIDLESFYNAADVCDTIVATDRTVAGKVNGQKQVITVADEGSRPTDLEKHTYENVLWYTTSNSKYWYWNKTTWVETTLTSTRPIPLYECNLTLDSSAKIRDNIESIMSTMGLAELTWSSEGKYKLLVEHPTSDSETDALVDSSHYFTDDDIIRGDVFNISYSSAVDRLNQVTVSFLNEHEDFKDDAVTWPKTNSVAHQAYLAEDNDQPFQSQTKPSGVTDPYHATAMAEQMVRQSRANYIVDFTVSKKGLNLEPGDFININSTVSNITDEVFRVQSIKILADFTVKVSVYKFNHEVLAWNVADDIAYVTAPVFDFTVDAPTNLAFTSTPDILSTSPGKLTWTAADDISATKYLVEVNGSGGEYITLGETTATSFDIVGLNTDTYDFSVRSVSSLGKKSDRIELLNQSIDKITVGNILVVYANTANEATNTQSTTLGSNEFVAYYPYTGDTPTLPITSGIEFVKFVGADGTNGIDGADGVDGLDGNQGIPGTDGSNGTNGSDGTDGADGTNGTNGLDGADGNTTYFHVAYGTSSSGAGFSQSPTGKTYIGTYVDFTATDSSTPGDYTWALIKGAQGDDGDQGIPGTNGTNGNTSYLHIAYGTSLSGAGFSQSAAGKTHIGQYVDFNSTDSSTPGDYTWSLIKGDDGTDGTNGTNGTNGTDGADGETNKTIYYYQRSETGFGTDTVSSTYNFGTDSGSAGTSTGFSATFETDLYVGAKEGFPTGVTLSPDGSKMFVLGQSSDSVHRYNLSTAFDLSTASFSQSHSHAAQENNAQAIAFKPDGSKMFIMGTTTDRVWQYSLSANWDITTATGSPSSFVHGQSEISPKGLSFNSAGTKMYTIGSSGDKVYEYDLSTGWSIGTASFNGSLDISGKETNPQGVQISDNGSELYIAGYDSDAVHTYSLSTAYDVTTATFSTSLDTSSYQGSIKDFFITNNSSKLFIVGSVGDKVSELSISTGAFTRTIPTGSAPLYVLEHSYTTTDPSASTAISNNEGATAPVLFVKDGGEAPRFNTVTVYSTTQLTSTPSTPSATFTWSTGVVSGLTAGYALSAPTQVASTAGAIYSSVITFYDSTGTATSSSATGTTPVAAVQFSGLVSFTSGAFSQGGSTITNIDGGNITTGSISGSPSGISPPTAGSAPTGTQDGTSIDLTNGKITIGDKSNYIKWDASDLTIKGDIVNLNPSSLSAQTGNPFNISGTGFTGADLDGAGAYIFILTGGGSGGTGAIVGDSPYPDSAIGGSAGGMAIFAFDWNGSTALSVAIGNGGNAGRSRSSTANDTSVQPLNGYNSTFSYNGTVMVTANGGTAPSSIGGVDTDSVGGTVVYNIPSGLNMLSQISRTGQGSDDSCGGACDFFGDLSSTHVLSNAGGSIFGAMGNNDDILDTRTVMGNGSASVVNLGYGGSLQLTESLANQYSSAITAEEGGLFAGGGGARRHAGTTTGGFRYATGGKGGYGGGGGGGLMWNVMSPGSSGGKGGQGIFFWSKL